MPVMQIVAVGLLLLVLLTPLERRRLQVRPCAERVPNRPTLPPAGGDGARSADGDNERRNA